MYFCRGELAEWSIAAVLKTVDLQGSGGSNPSLSAAKNVKRCKWKFTAFFITSLPKVRTNIFNRRVRFFQR